MSERTVGKRAYTVRGLTQRIGGRDVLAGIDLDVRYGSVLALVGPNGAGKSTLLAVLAGDVEPGGGTVELDGAPLRREPRRLARQRSVLLQSNQVAFGFTVRQIVEMGRNPWIGTGDGAHDEALVTRALARTDTAALAGRNYRSLSGGEQARVCLARVLAQDTPIVLLDEPTASLDLRHQEDVLTIACELAAAGRAVVLVLHDLGLAAAYADWVAMLDRGRLVALGTPAETLTAARIEQVYGTAVHLLADPDSGRPVIVPVRPPRSGD